MKRRKWILEQEHTIYNKSDISIINSGNQIIYEIKGNSTLDIVEATSILMSLSIEDLDIWNIPIINLDKNLITPEKTLYWLSGGDKEWVILDNYSISWYDCHDIFCLKFGHLVHQSVEHSKTLNDIRKFLKQNLNLAIIWDWAISKGFVS